MKIFVWLRAALFGAALCLVPQLHRFRAALLAFGLGLARAASGQDAPVYPPPAPLDTPGGPRPADAQIFANSPVVGMGPSKGLIVKYERIPGNFSLRSTGVGGVADYRTDVVKNANLIVKAYAPLLNQPA